jgi:cytochrome c-type biogenesis protein CcmF
MALGATVLSWRRKGINNGGMIAHAGLALSLFAIVLAGSGSQSYSREMAVGERYEIFGHEVVFVGQEFMESGKEKYYVYQVDGQEVKALTKLRANGEDAAREPAIAKDLGGDVYIAPTPPQDNGRMEMILKQGRMSMDEDFAYRFEKVSVEKNEQGGMTVTADVAITDGNTVEHADLVLVGTRDGGTAKPVEIYGGQKRLRLTGVTQNQKQIRIESMPSVEAESKQPITTSVSVKPCIWLLWLGSIMVCVGTLWAVKRF